MNYEKVMDERQRHVHEHFSSSNYLGDPHRVQKLMDWITFGEETQAVSYSIILGLLFTFINTLSCF